VFHNGDVYPNAYDTVHEVTDSKTDAPLTVADRLLPLGDSHRLDRFVYWVVSTWPFGKAVRQHVIDPILFRGEDDIAEAAELGLTYQDRQFLKSIKIASDD
jgi:hypothetical protein